MTKQTGRPRTSTTKKVINRRKPIEDHLPDGRPTLYRTEFCQQLIDFFSVEHYTEKTFLNAKTGNECTDRVANKLPTMAGFAGKLGVGLQTLRDWTKARPEFAMATRKARAIGEDMLVQNALLGLYDSRMALLVATNYTELRNIQEHRELEPNGPLDTPEDIEKQIAAADREIERLKAML